MHIVQAKAVGRIPADWGMKQVAVIPRFVFPWLVCAGHAPVCNVGKGSQGSKWLLAETEFPDPISPTCVLPFCRGGQPQGMLTKQRIAGFPRYRFHRMVGADAREAISAILARRSADIAMIPESLPLTLSQFMFGDEEWVD
jgi:hypothetical protein